MQENQPIGNWKETDLDEFELTPFQSKHTSRDATGPCSVSIVNTQKNGKRITISEEVLNRIDGTETVSLASYREGIAIGQVLPGVSVPPFILRRSGKKGVVYCGGLVDELTELFQLDFSGRTTISFEEVKYQEKDGIVVAFVPLRQFSSTEGRTELEPSEHYEPDEETEDALNL